MLVFLKVLISIIKFVNEPYDFWATEEEFDQMYALFEEAGLLNLRMLGILRQFVRE